MDTELKAKWIAALRSGDYQQGKYHLRYRDEFCCLGVLCEVAGIPKKADGEAILYQVPSATGEWTDITEPHEVAGLLRPDIGTLTGMNDDGVSFDDIADYIEANL